MNVLPRLTLASLILVATPSFGGTVRGTVRVPAGGGQARVVHQAYPGQAGSLPDPTPIVHGLVTDAVVWIEGLPAEAESAMARPSARPQMAQKNQNFVPRVLAVAAGETVDFPNFDPIFHNAFSVSPSKRFDLGKYPRGQSRKVRFPKPGVVQVFCDIHANMAAFIRVLPTRAFADPDGFGEFAIAGVPPGTYTMKVWHPDLPVLDRRITVPASGNLQVVIDYSAPRGSGVAESGR
jgi:plastocyanin